MIQRQDNLAFQTTKNFLIDLIENRKGFVRLKRMREKYIDYIIRLEDFTIDNLTIEKKELTQIKNSLDKLYGSYYGGDKDFHTKRKNELEQLAKDKGVSHYFYGSVGDPAIDVLSMMNNYSMSNAKRNLEKNLTVDFNIEERLYVDKYYSNFDKWAELNDKIEEIRKILNPTAKERKLKELKEIKGKLNPAIKTVIDDIAENFRQVIEKNELGGYEKSLEQFRTKHGDSISYEETTKIINRRYFMWGGVNQKLYIKPKNTTNYSYVYDLVLVSNYQKIMEDVANQVSYDTIVLFKSKMYDKIGGMITDIDKDFKVEVLGDKWTYNDIFFTFEDGSKFSIRNKIVSNVNQQNTFYYTYPTTFHDAYLPNGEKISKPNEYTVKKSFNDYYNKK